MARNKGGNRLGVWIIVGLLFVGLIGFGSAGLVAGARTVGTVGDKDITVQAYANDVREALDGYSRAFNTPVTLGFLEQLGQQDVIIEQTIRERVLDNEAASLGLSAGDARIAQAVRGTPAFQSFDGTFDRATYRAALNQLGESEREYETGLRETLARALLQGAVVSGIEAPAIYTDTLLAHAGERRSFTYTEITEANLATPVAAPDDDAVAAWFEARADAYLSPEVRDVTYAWVTPGMLSDSLEIDEAELRALYDERIADYVQDERRLTERLVFSTDEAATAALARIEGGEIDFEDLVAERGLDLANVDMGDMDAAGLGAAGEAVFAAAPGDVVGPFETPLGPALFRMNAVLGAQEVTFEDARDDLAVEVATAQARRRIADTEEQLADLLAGGASLEDMAERTDLDLGTLAWSAGMTDGPAAYDLFRETIAATEPDARPALVELDDGGIFALRVDAVTAPAPQPLDAVRDTVVADLLAERTAERVAALAADFIAFLDTRGDFDDLGLATQTQENLLRRDFVAGTPEGFMEEVFAMAPGDLATLPTATGTLIVRLDAIAPVDPEDATMQAERADIAAQAAGSIAQDIYTAYTGVLRNRTDVSIDPRAVAAVHDLYR